MLHSRHRAAHKRFAKEKEHPQSFSALLKSVLCALPLTVLSGALLLLVTTAVLLNTADPDHYHVPAGMLLSYLTAAIGGMLATLFYGRRSPALCGFFEGVCLFLLLSVPALFLKSADGNAALSLLYRVLIFPASLVGAYLGSRKKTRRGRRF
ncbi:MAG: hypothetical protein E7624_03255 [Ruminococcaceae bacterium]|nr:hypothetical protein [Oscillospiraceae bacterium]